MSKAIYRAMPNLLAKNKPAAIGLLLLLLAGGMIFFAGGRLNEMIAEAFQATGVDGIASFAGMLAIALILAAGGYHIMKKT